MEIHEHWADKFLDHYREYFVYEPVDIRQFRRWQEYPSIQVMRFDNVFSKSALFISLGFSRYHMIVDDTAEVYLALDAGFDKAPSILAESLFYIIENKMKFGWGIAITFDRLFPEFSQDCKKTAIYFTRVFGIPGFAQVELGNRNGRIYSAFLISKEEFEHFEANGAISLEDQLEKANIDVLDIYRQSVI